jgi:YidC/Oxa1 family membrane protein insertase
MESQRSFLIIGLALVTFLLWQAWQKDYGPQPINPVQQEQTQQANQGVPSFDEAQSEDVPTSDSVPAAQAIAQTQNTNRIIEVKTDTLDVRIDLLGGDVISANLIKFPVTQGSDEPYSLLRSGMGLYVAQSGLIGKQGPDASATGRPVYTAQQSAYQLNGDTLVVPLTWKNSQGLSITKTFTFTQGHYDVNVSYDVQNATNTAANVQPYAQLKQVMDFEDDGNMFMPTYRGAAFSQPKMTNTRSILLTKLKMRTCVKPLKQVGLACLNTTSCLHGFLLKNKPTPFILAILIISLQLLVCFHLPRPSTPVSLKQLPQRSIWVLKTKIALQK